MTDTDKPVTVAEDDRRRATEVDDHCASGDANPVEAIALAIAETRMLTTRILEQDHDRRLHRVAESKDARIAELERERAEAPLQSRIDDVEQQWGAAERRYYATERELSNRIAELTRERDEDRAHNRQLRADNVTLRGKIVKLEGIIHRKNADLSNLVQERDEARADLELLRQEMHALGEKVERAGETPEAVAIRHLKGVDHDPILRPAKTAGDDEKLI